MWIQGIIYAGAALAIIISAGMPGAISQGPSMTERHHDDSTIYRKVLAALDSIESEDFLADTYFASDHGVVEDMLAGKETIRTIAAHPSIACPLLEERIGQRDLLAPPLVGYFFALGEAGCRDAIPLLAGYLTTLSDSLESETNDLLWPWHPGLHAVTALHKLTDRAIRFDPDAEPRAELLHMAEAAGRWHERWRERSGK